MNEQKNEYIYDPQTVEADAQQYWYDNNAFVAHEDQSREKFYCLAMFPYPSGRLHIGHIRNYAISDAISRYQRMQGKNVLQPMGWDAFGLPAENAAIANKTSAAEWTYQNIAVMRTQMRRMGFAYDWSREIATCRPDYYRWEQWFFTRLLRKGLAYRQYATVNWDPVDQTVLANEQINADGTAWRSGAQVEQRRIEQWFIRSTAYADELLQGLKGLEGKWPDQVISAQREWIGRSEGLEIDFVVAGNDFQTITVFTTRPDTIMGVNILALAPDHPLVCARAKENTVLADFIASCWQTGISERATQTAEKRGMPIDALALHPINGAKIPIWVANFVVSQYGTGAVMVVPAHDNRDHQFSVQYDLPIKPVVQPPQPVDFSKQAYTGYGEIINSGDLDGLDYHGAFQHIEMLLAPHRRAHRSVHYKLRDWGVSRQRYWGCPIPVIYDKDGKIHPESDDNLPIVLPEDVTADVRSPLADMSSFTQAIVPRTGEIGRRETDTFDTFVESSWYYVRYCAPDADALTDTRADYWLPVDQYIGGIEHATMHLMYARLFHRLLRDANIVRGDEPFNRLLCQGMVVDRFYYRDASNDGDGRKDYFSPDELDITLDDGGNPVQAVCRADGGPVSISDHKVKVSKSKKNGIDLGPLLDKYGADALRLFVLFAAPPEKSLEWSEAGLNGCSRFLQRLWRAAHAAKATTASVEDAHLDTTGQMVWRAIHATIAQVTDAIGSRYKFNTAIAAAMELLNTIQQLPDDTSQAMALRRYGVETIVLLLAPIVPHICHTLWLSLGHTQPLVSSQGDVRWPTHDETALYTDTVTLAVQVNGKRRAEITVPSNADRQMIIDTALAHPNIQQHVGDKAIRNTIVVPAKIVNVVTA